MSRNYVLNTGNGVSLFVGSNQNVGFHTAQPTEKLSFEQGNAKFNSNVYVMRRMGVSTSNPAVELDVSGDAKVSGNFTIHGNMNIGAPILVNGFYVTKDSNTSQTTSLSTAVENMDVSSAGTRFLITNSSQAFQFSVGQCQVPLLTIPGSQSTTVLNTPLQVMGDILPSSNLVYNLGNSNMRFKDLYLSGNSISLGNVMVSSDSNNGTITFQNTSTNSSAAIIAKEIVIQDNGQTAKLTFSNNQLRMMSVSNNVQQGDISGIPNVFSSNMNIGIGVSNPSMRLQVSDDAIINTARIGSYPFDRSQAIFAHSNVNASTGYAILQTSNGDTVVNAASGRSINFKINNNDAIGINSQGFMGIGTQNPSVALDVVGNAKLGSNVEVLGNLTVRGNTTTVESTTVNVTDNIIRINNGASYTSQLQAGIEVNRGTGQCNYSFIFDEALNYFRIGRQGELQTVATRDDAPFANSLAIYDSANRKYTGCNNLVYSNNMLGVGISNPLVALTVNSMDGIIIPSGTSLQRPAVSRHGVIRYNTTTNSFEGCDSNNVWTPFGSSLIVDNDTSLSTSNVPSSRVLSLTNTVAISSSNTAISACNIAISASNQAFLPNLISTTVPFFQPPLNTLGSNAVRHICRIQGGHWGVPITFSLSGSLNESMTSMHALFSTSFRMAANQWYKVPSITHTNFDATAFLARVLVRSSNNAIDIALAREAGTQLSFSSNMFAMVQCVGRSFGGPLVFSNISDTPVLNLNSTEYNNLQYWANTQYSNEAFSVASRNQIWTGASVGIGTSNPLESLHVVSGKIFAANNQILGYINDTSAVPAFSWGDDSNTGIYHPSADTIAFTNNGLESVRIASTGSMGIGTTSITNRVTIGGETTQFPCSLMINETSHITSRRAAAQFGNWMLMQDINGDGTRNFGVYQGNAGGVSPLNALNILTNGNIGISTTTPGYRLHVVGDVFATQDVIAFSDKRVKTNLENIDSPMKIIENLKGWYYERSDDPLKRRQVGFLAQDVNNVLPEVVRYDTNNDLYGINYGHICTVLVEAVKELSQDINKLKDDVRNILRSRSQLHE